MGIKPFLDIVNLQSDSAWWGEFGEYDLNFEKEAKPLPQYNHPTTAIQCDNSVLSCSASVLNPSPSVFESCCAPTFGLLIMSIQWTKGYCRGRNAKRRCKAAKAKTPHFFTIHGQWVNECDGGYVQFCDSERQITPEKTMEVLNTRPDLLKDMQTYWPSAMPKGDSYFWSYEYNKHGTCNSVYHPQCYLKSDWNTGFDALAYFEATIREYKKLPDLLALLAKNNIYPDEKRRYTYEELSVATGLRWFYCITGKSKRTKYLHEILIPYRGGAKDRKFEMDINLPLRDGVMKCPESGIIFAP